MSTLAIVLIILLLFGGVGVSPAWGYSRGWGWGPSGLVGILLVVLIIAVLLGAVRV
jgi:hypothetical protein